MKPIITVKNLCLWYGKTQALKNIYMEVPEKSITGADRPVRLWEIYIFENAQSYERFNSQCENHRRGVI